MVLWYLTANNFSWLHTDTAETVNLINSIDLGVVAALDDLKVKIVVVKISFWRICVRTTRKYVYK